MDPLGYRPLWAGDGAQIGPRLIEAAPPEGVAGRPEAAQPPTLPAPILTEDGWRLAHGRLLAQLTATQHRLAEVEAQTVRQGLQLDALATQLAGLDRTTTLAFDHVRAQVAALAAWQLWQESRTWGARWRRLLARLRRWR